MVEKEQLRQLDGLEADGGAGVGGVLCEHKMNSVGLGFEAAMAIVRGSAVLFDTYPFASGVFDSMPSW